LLAGALAEAARAALPVGPMAAGAHA